jgi:hypothetical protein
MNIPAGTLDPDSLPGCSAQVKIYRLIACDPQTVPRGDGAGGDYDE